MLLKLDSNIEISQVKSYTANANRTSCTEGYAGQAEYYSFYTAVVGSVYHLYFGLNGTASYIDLGECAGQYEYSGSASVSITTKIRVDRYISVDNNTSMSDLFWYAYSGDKSGAGMPFQKGDIFYRPYKYSDGYGRIETITTFQSGVITKTVVSTTSPSADSKYYLPNLDAELHGFAGNALLDSEVMLASCSFTGFPIANTPVELTNDYNDRTVYSSSGLALYTQAGRNGMAQLSTYSIIQLKCPPYACAYTGSRLNWDDTEEATLTHSDSYDGVYSFELWGADVFYSDDAQAYDATARTVTHSVGELDCRSLNQADFPFQDYTAVPPGDYYGYNDGRLDLPCSDLALNGVLDVSVPMSKDVATFEYSDGWSVTAGIATLSEVELDSTVWADVTANGTEISCDYTGGPTLAGGRYIEVVYESDDTEAITLTMAGSTWNITPGMEDDVDLLAPLNRSGIDDTQTIRGDLADVELAADNYVVCGLLPSTGSDFSPLSCYTMPGTATISGTTYNFESEIVECEASKDTYLYVSTSDFCIIAVANGAAQPTTPAGYYPLAKLVSDADEITTVTTLTSGITYTGLIPEIYANLGSYVSDGVCVINDTRIVQAEEFHVYTAERDTYVDTSGTTFSYTVVANNDPEPSIPANHLRLAKVVTSASRITTVTDMRTTNVLTLDTPQVVSWGWGVHSPGTIKFSGLRDGHYYNFKKITLKRHSLTFDIHLFRNPFVGNDPNDPRSDDLRSLYQVGIKLFDGGTSTAHLTRMGVVMVDGVVGAELFGTVHIYLPSSVDPYWIHDHVYIDSAEFCYPSGGLVDFTVNTPGVPATWLGSEPIEVTGTTYNFNAQGYVHSLKCSAMSPGRSFSVTKRYKGQGCLRIVNREGTECTGSLATKLLDTNDPIATEYLVIPASGVGITPSLFQPQMDYVTVVSGSGSSYVITGAARDYTGFTLYAMDVISDVSTPVACGILSHNTETGAITLDYSFTTALTGTSEVGVLLPYNYVLTIDEQDIPLVVRNRSFCFATLIVSIGASTLKMFTAYQEPFSNVERVFGPDVNSKATNFKCIAGTITQENLSATDLVDAVQAYLTSSGKSRAYYSLSDGSSLSQHATDDEWLDALQSAVPDPDATPLTGDTWDKYNFITTLPQAFRTSRDVSGNKVTGQLLAALWYGVTSSSLGRIAVVPVGEDTDADKWTSWSALNLLVPIQAPSLLSTNSGNIQLLYHDNALGLKLANLSQTGELGDIWTIASNVYSKHPSAVLVSNKAFVVTWESDTKTLKYRSYETSNTGWTLIQESAFNSAIAEGDAIAYELSPQRVALYLDNAQKLRCFRWENNLLVPSTLHQYLPGV